MNKTLLLVAHGSRSDISNQAVIDLAERLNQKLDNYQSVKACFIELTTPKLDATIEQLADDGITHIDVFSYFLAPGVHLTKDIPNILEQCRQKHPDLFINAIDSLTNLDGFENFLVNQLSNY